MHAFTYSLYDCIACYSYIYVATCMYVKTDVHEYNIICIIYILIYTAIAIVYTYHLSFLYSYWTYIIIQKRSYTYKLAIAIYKYLATYIYVQNSLLLTMLSS